MNASACLPRLSIAALVAIACSLLLISPAGASVTIGAELTGTPTDVPSACAVQTAGVERSCTVTAKQITSPAETAPGGLTSPIDGVVVRWRLRAGGSPNVTTSIKVQARTLESTLNFLPLHTGALHDIAAGGGSYSFEERLPIPAGGAIGLDSFTVGNGVGAGPAIVAVIGTAARYANVTPAVADGVSTIILGGIGGPTPMNKLMVNADVEPDVDGDGFGDETQDGCPTVASAQGACPQTAPDPAPALTGISNADTVFSFSSSTPGNVAITIESIKAGHKKLGKCSSKAEHGARCNIFKKIAAFSSPIVAGANSINYKPKVGGKPLKPGKYRVTFVATNAIGVSASSQFNLTIKAKKKKKKSTK